MWQKISASILIVQYATFFVIVIALSLLNGVIVMHQQYDVDLLVALVKSAFPDVSQKALEEVVSALKALAASTESDDWKELGNQFFEKAKEVRDSSEVFTYCLFGGACLGRSVDLARAKCVPTGGQS